MKTWGGSVSEVYGLWDEANGKLIGEVERYMGDSSDRMFGVIRVVVSTKDMILKIMESAIREVVKEEEVGSQSIFKFQQGKRRFH